MNRVLMTGASGFIGSACLPRLRQHGFEVHAVSSQAREDGDGIVWHKANLLQTGCARALWRRIRPSHVLHLAWHVSPADYRNSPENLRWLTASLELFQASLKSTSVRFVFAGTCIDEEGCRGGSLPVNFYRDCKSTLRGIVAAARPQLEAHRVNAAWARIFYPYGPGEAPSRLVPSVIRGLLLGRAVPCSSGTQRRDFIAVDDVAAALVAILEGELTGPADIGCGRAPQVAEVVNEIGRQLGRQELIQFGSLPDSAEPPLLMADLSRISQLGWRPRMDLVHGVTQAIRYWQEIIVNEHRSEWMRPGTVRCDAPAPAPGVGEGTGGAEF